MVITKAAYWLLENIFQVDWAQCSILDSKFYYLLNLTHIGSFILQFSFKKCVVISLGNDWIDKMLLFTNCLVELKVIFNTFFLI